MTPTCDIIVGDCIEELRKLPADSVHCVVTSPPYYGLRDYGMADQIGLEETPAEFTAKLAAVFEEVRRVLRPDGTCWINLGDSYVGNPGGGQGSDGAMVGRSVAAAREAACKIHRARKMPLPAKNLMGIPWRVAFALQDAGWWLRTDIVWSKMNPTPESTKDRPSRSHEFIFLLTKSANYHYDKDALREPYHPATIKRGRSIRNVAADGAVTYRFNGEDLDEASIAAGRNCRTVWHLPTQPFRGAHFATMPREIVRRCIVAGCPGGGTVLDPFGGSGTTGLVALELGRAAILIELNPDYAAIARARIGNSTPGLNLA